MIRLIVLSEVDFFIIVFSTAFVASMLSFVLALFITFIQEWLSDFFERRRSSQSKICSHYTEPVWIETQDGKRVIALVEKDQFL